MWRYVYICRKGHRTSSERCSKTALNKKGKKMKKYARSCSCECHNNNIRWDICRTSLLLSHLLPAVHLCYSKRNSISITRGLRIGGTRVDITDGCFERFWRKAGNWVSGHSTPEITLKQRRSWNSIWSRRVNRDEDYSVCMCILRNMLLKMGRSLIWTVSSNNNNQVFS